ncbi:MAG TPA: hypothetical protein ENI23_11525 [bacterium]|nr:hypothetical protein [bacterium]
MSVGINVSNKGFDADEASDIELSFSSKFYMHTIGQTEFRQTTGANERVQHGFGYIPIVLSYSESTTKNKFLEGFSGADITNIEISVANGTRDRYYALYQGI